MTDLRIPATVKIADNEHGAILLNTSDGTMYGLNPSAAVFCAALSTGGDRRTATDAVIDAFDAEADVIRADLDTVVAELLDLKLLAEVP
jgi:hypothetical protein